MILLKFNVLKDILIHLNDKEREQTVFFVHIKQF